MAKMDRRAYAEMFGPTVGEWRTNASSGKIERWRYICRLLDIEGDCQPAIRYQLFHRTVSALVEAERFCARAAAVVVHSFSPTAESFGDFQRFVGMLGATLAGQPEPSEDEQRKAAGWFTARDARMAAYAEERAVLGRADVAGLVPSAGLDHELDDLIASVLDMDDPDGLIQIHPPRSP